MLITFNQCIAGIGFTYSAGETADFPDAEAQRFINAGIAYKVDTPVEQASKEPAQKAVRRGKTKGTR